MKQLTRKALFRPKRILPAVLLLAALGFIIYVCLISIGPRHLDPASVPPASAALRRQTQTLDSTVLWVDVDAALRTLSCRQETTYRNRSGEALDRVQLRLYPNAFKRAWSPAQPNQPRAAGEAFITEVRVNDRAAAWAVSTGDETVLDVPVALAPAESCTLSLVYTLTLPETAGRLGQSSGVTIAGGAFAHVAVLEDGHFRDDAYTALGDPLLPDAQNFTLHLTLPDDRVTAAVGGAPRARTGRTTTYESLGARDISFSLSRSYHLQQAQHGNTCVSAYARSAQGARQTLAHALRALDLYEALFEYAYPYPTLTLAQGDLGDYGGMEYTGLAIIGDASYAAGSDALSVTIAHEIAHQWFGVLVGSDSLRTPWLDEALSEYASLLYVEKAHGQHAFDALYAQKIEPALRLTRAFGVTTGAPLDVFASMSEYAQVVYQRGAGMLHGLREAIGLDAYCDFLHAYVSRFAFAQADRADFAALLRDVTGSDWTGYLDDYLDS